MGPDDDVITVQWSIASQVFVRSSHRLSGGSLVVVQNWHEELKRLVPTH